jgi:Leucine-rich repeat (LRR) protein
MGDNVAAASTKHSFLDAEVIKSSLNTVGQTHAQGTSGYAYIRCDAVGHGLTSLTDKSGTDLTANQLVHIRVLNVNNNNLTRLDAEELKDLQSLVTITAAKNRIRELSDLSHLRFLKLLDLSGNSLTSLKRARARPTAGAHRRQQIRILKQPC